MAKLELPGFAHLLWQQAHAWSATEAPFYPATALKQLFREITKKLCHF